MPGAPKIWLSQEQHGDFQRFARSHTLPARLVERARIILRRRTRQEYPTDRRRAPPTGVPAPRPRLPESAPPASDGSGAHLASSPIASQPSSSATTPALPKKVKRWLVRHPRFHLHFIPASSPWLNMVERFFRDLTDKCIRRGVFHSVPEFEEAIRNPRQQGHTSLRDCPPRPATRHYGVLGVAAVA